MKTGIELYQVFEDNQHLFLNGICSWLDSLYSFSKISHEERRFVYNTLTTYRILKEIKSTYYWPVGQIKPRLEWLKQTLIK